MSLSRGLNILVGQNNSGKSSVIHSIHWLQKDDALQPTDIRIGCKECNVEMTFNGDDIRNYVQSDGNQARITLNDAGKKNRQIRCGDGNYQSFNMFTSIEPVNFIYPFLSKRKVIEYSEVINSGVVQQITGNFQHLYAKIDRVSSISHSAHEKYMNACRNILGIPIVATQSSKGKKASYLAHNNREIAVDAMGEGVANILGFLADVFTANGKLFLIEEIENDVHPKALKELLDIIIESSSTNQFVITTHSHIVLKILGGCDGAAIFLVSHNFNGNVPSSTVERIDTSVCERMRVLNHLGYELHDIDLWEAWLILEESSAEVIIRDYLIPWFTPSIMTKLRTFSARTLSEVRDKVEAFNRVCVYLHLQPLYRDRTWIIVDDGAEEKKVIDTLRGKYAPSGWKIDRFMQFSEHDFERYYPEEFMGKIDAVLKIDDSKKKQREKRLLLEEVKVWIAQDAGKASAEFTKSAAKVIEILKMIEKEILGTT